MIPYMYIIKSKISDTSTTGVLLRIYRPKLVAAEKVASIVCVPSQNLRTCRNELTKKKKCESMTYTNH